MLSIDILLSLSLWTQEGRQKKLESTSSFYYLSFIISSFLQITKDLYVRLLNVKILLLERLVSGDIGMKN